MCWHAWVNHLGYKAEASHTDSFVWLINLITSTLSNVLFELKTTQYGWQALLVWTHLQNDQLFCVVHLEERVSTKRKPLTTKLSSSNKILISDSQVAIKESLFSSANRSREMIFFPLNLSFYEKGLSIGRQSINEMDWLSFTGLGDWNSSIGVVVRRVRHSDSDLGSHPKHCDHCIRGREREKPDLTLRSVPKRPSVLSGRDRVLNCRDHFGVLVQLLVQD